MKRLPILVLALVFAGFATSSASSQFVASCGDEATSGLVLYNAYDEVGRASIPPLALLNPATGEIRQVLIEDPREVAVFAGTCMAQVTTAIEEHWAVNGVSGDVIQLADPNEPEFVSRSGAGYFALLTPGGGETWHQGRILDIRSGDIQALFRASFPDDLIRSMFFSPKGSVLIMLLKDENAVLSLRYGGKWQILEGQGLPLEHGFDDAEDRMLVLSRGLDSIQTLSLFDIRTATSKEIMSAPVEAINGFYVEASFVPGSTDTISVLFPDHFAILDVSGDVPRTVKSIDGMYGHFWLAPDLSGVLLEGRAPKQGHTYVNFSDGEVLPIGAELGWPVSFRGSVSTSSVLLYSSAGFRVRSLTSLNLSTGETQAFPIAPEESVEISSLRTSQNGEYVLVVAGIKNNRQRINLFNAKTGEVKLLAEAGRVSGSVSPDGNWVVFTTLEKTEAGRIITMTLMNSSTGEMTTLAPGLNPIWLY